MNIVMLEEFLLWCFIINYSILLLWFVMIVYAKEFIYNIHTKWFDISKEKFNSINYSWMGFYKLSVFLFNMVPYIALQMLK
ncbi:hypothetical protein N9A28_09840 [Sulfurimonas sp.]|nr:hypothetical protein [Sulfurimonas sp.]